MIQSALAFFFFNDTATTEIYTLSLHDALPILCRFCGRFTRLTLFGQEPPPSASRRPDQVWMAPLPTSVRSEEHTSELQSRSDLVCRLLLEKKKGRVDVSEDAEARLSGGRHDRV